MKYTSISNENRFACAQCVNSHSGVGEIKMTAIRISGLIFFREETKNLIEINDDFVGFGLENIEVGFFCFFKKLFE